MRRLLFDVTRTLQSGQHTGIQRVVRRLWQALHVVCPPAQVQLQAVVFEGRHWRAIADLPPHPLEGRSHSTLPVTGAYPAAIIEPTPDDILLLADASWYLDPWPAVTAALDNGAQLAGLVHDLLPLQQPQWFRPQLQAVFAAHLTQLVAQASLLLTPSQVVGRALRLHIAGTQPGAECQARVVCQPLGADFWSNNQAGKARQLPLELLPGQPFALMVGTIEPRKNHRLVLAAFEALWAQGSTLQLVLVGAPGWCSDSLLARLDSHAERGQRLHWFKHLPDSQLHALYSTASTLVFASLDEGFGLPLAEAAYLGCPVLAADIAVLREVGGDWPTYLPVDGIAHWLAALQELPAPTARIATLHTWEQTARQLLGHLAALPQTTAVAATSC